MKRPEFIARQSANPTGPVGAVIARIMAKETVAENSQALALLELQPDDRFLEIGAGHGATLNAASNLIDGGFIAGLDISRVMVRLANKVNRAEIKSGNMEIRRASSDQIPYPASAFNKALAVHTIYFWSEPAKHFDEVFRTLAPGGKFLLCFRPSEDAGFAEAFPETVYHIRSKEEVLNGLKLSGFEISSVHDEATGRGQLVFALAQKPEPQ